MGAAERGLEQCQRAPRADRQLLQLQGQLCWFSSPSSFREPRNLAAVGSSLSCSSFFLFERSAEMLGETVGQSSAGSSAQTHSPSHRKSPSLGDKLYSVVSAPQIRSACSGVLVGSSPAWLGNELEPPETVPLLCGCRAAALGSSSPVCCSCELFPGPSSAPSHPWEYCPSLCSAIDSQRSNTSAFGLVSCENCSESGLGHSHVWDPGPGGVGIPHSFWEADGSCAKWLLLFPFPFYFSYSIALFEGQNWLLSVFLVVPHTQKAAERGAVGPPEQAQGWCAGILQIWSELPQRQRFSAPLSRPTLSEQSWWIQVSDTIVGTKK